MKQRNLIIILALATATVFANIGGLDIYALDEAKNAEAAREMYAQIFRKRNKVMLERIQELTPEGKLFVAVGAGHLSGRDGLIDLLRRSGYIVEAVEPR